MARAQLFAPPPRMPHPGLGAPHHRRGGPQFQALSRLLSGPVGAAGGTRSRWIVEPASSPRPAHAHAHLAGDMAEDGIEATWGQRPDPGRRCCRSACAPRLPVLSRRAALIRRAPGHAPRPPPAGVRLGHETGWDEDAAWYKGPLGAPLRLYKRACYDTRWGRARAPCPMRPRGWRGCAACASASRPPPPTRTPPHLRPPRSPDLYKTYARGPEWYQVRGSHQLPLPPPLRACAPLPRRPP